MTRIAQSLLILSLLGTVIDQAGAKEPASLPLRLPNIVFILADDLGWSDTTLFGHTELYQTPNLERLMKRGMLFSRAYAASPLCSPTRASILTGMSPARVGITAPTCHLPTVTLQANTRPNGPPTAKATVVESATRLDTKYVTLAERLQQAGYTTGHFGKWHLGAEPFSPLQQGFEIDLPHHAGPGPAGSYVAPWKFKDFKAKVAGEHIEDRMGDEAVAWIKANKDRPFFLNYWQFSVHAPFDAKPTLIEKYRSLVKPESPQRSPTYAAMVQSLDENIGKMLDTLDELGLTDNTAVIFFSDNGGNMYNEIDGTTPTSNLPLRGGKATMFEGGIRVPAIVSWPAVTTAGVRSEAMIQSTDFYPTILSLLDLPATPNHPLDGVDITPALQGKPFDRGPLFTYFPHQPGVPDNLPPSVSVHRGDWKLIRLFHQIKPGEHDYLLYNLREDIGEQNNVAAQHVDLVQELDVLLTDFLQRTHAVIPQPNPNYNASATKSSPRNGKPAPARVGIWTYSKDSQLKIANGVVHLTSTGGDPWIATRALTIPKNGPYQVQVTIRSNAKGEGVLYYSSNAKPGFDREHSVAFPLKHNGESNTYHVRLPEQVSDITAIRLDPGNGMGEIVIDELQVQSVDPAAAKD